MGSHTLTLPSSLEEKSILFDEMSRILAASFRSWKCRFAVVMSEMFYTGQQNNCAVYELRSRA